MNRLLNKYFFACSFGAANVYGYLIRVPTTDTRTESVLSVLFNIHNAIYLVLLAVIVHRLVIACGPNSRSGESIGNQWLPLRVLRAFKWFCRNGGRQDIKDVLADLPRDVRAMKKEGRSQWFISTVLLWQAVRSIAGVLWGGALSVLKDFVPILKAFRRPKS